MARAGQARISRYARLPTSRTSPRRHSSHVRGRGATKIPQFLGRSTPLPPITRQERRKTQPPSDARQPGDDVSEPSDAGEEDVRACCSTVRGVARAKLRSKERDMIRWKEAVQKVSAKYVKVDEEIIQDDTSDDMPEDVVLNPEDTSVRKKQPRADIETATHRHEEKFRPKVARPARSPRQPLGPLRGVPVIQKRPASLKWQVCNKRGPRLPKSPVSHQPLNVRKSPSSPSRLDRSRGSGSAGSGKRTIQSAKIDRNNDNDPQVRQRPIDTTDTTSKRPAQNPESSACARKQPNERPQRGGRQRTRSGPTGILRKDDHKKSEKVSFGKDTEFNQSSSDEFVAWRQDEEMLCDTLKKKGRPSIMERIKRANDIWSKALTGKPVKVVALSTAKQQGDQKTQRLRVKPSRLPVKDHSHRIWSSRLWLRRT